MGEGGFSAIKTQHQLYQMLLGGEKTSKYM